MNTKITVHDGHRQITHSVREDQVLCLRRGLEELEAWTTPMEVEINMEERVLVIDQEMICMYHRDASGTLWHMQITLNEQTMSADVRLPPLPTPEDPAGWVETGKIPVRVIPREAHHQYGLGTMLEQQQNAIISNECGSLEPATPFETESGLRVALRVIEPQVQASPAGEVIESPAPVEDLTQMIEEVLIRNHQRMWTKGPAWVELILDIEDNLDIQLASHTETGDMCTCNTVQLNVPAMQLWVGDLKYSVPALIGPDEAFESAQVVGAMLVIPGQPGRYVPEIYLLPGTVGLGPRPAGKSATVTPAAPALDPNRVIN